MEKTFINIEFWQLVGFLLSFLGICFTFGKLPARPYLPINGSGQLQNGADKRILDIAIESLSSGL